MKYNPKYVFKCGLEIHTQLKTRYKLFSLSKSSFGDQPNTNVSYFDLGLPGTQPKLNPEALLSGLLASKVLNCQIQSYSSFDRKHYFYPDQPLGYQITQHFHPLAKNGYIQMNENFDGINKRIRIQQVQLEQDTGKKMGDRSIDYNRANIPLIEVITDPDFETIDQVQAFVKKYQTLVTHLKISAGTMETGAIRVDANISVNDNPRVEIKNLGSSGEIVDALKYEYNRQINQLESGNVIIQETRGWNGKTTESSRSKEDAVDYRYVPDSELPPISIDQSMNKEIERIIPELPDEIMTRLTQKIELKYAKFLLNTPSLLSYYDELTHPDKNKWIFQELLGQFSKLNKPFDPKTITSKTLLQIINLDCPLTEKRNVVREMILNPRPLSEIYKPSSSPIDITGICNDIIENNQHIVEKLPSQPSVIQSLIGQAMKKSKGKVHANIFKTKFIELLKL